MDKLKNQISQLQKELSDLQSEISRREQDIKDLQSKIQNYEQELSKSVIKNIDQLLGATVKIQTSIWLEGYGYKSEELYISGSGVIERTDSSRVEILTSRHVAEKYKVAETILQSLNTEIDIDTLMCLLDETCTRTVLKCYADKNCRETQIVDSLCSSIYFSDSCTDYVVSKIEDCSNNPSCVDEYSQCENIYDKTDLLKCFYRWVRKYNLLPTLKSKITLTYYEGIKSEASEKDLNLIKDCWDYDIIRITASGSSKYSAQMGKNYKVGEEILVVGNPVGLNFSLSKGIISGIRNWKDIYYQGIEFIPGLSDILKDLNIPECDFKIIQHDAATNPGSSGGGLFKLSDNSLVGIVFSSILYSQSINFAISVDDLTLFSAPYFYMSTKQDDRFSDILARRIGLEFIKIFKIMKNSFLNSKGLLAR